MRITESQLRRIIRQEARRLTEMPTRRPAAGRGRATPAASRGGAKKNYLGQSYSSIARDIVTNFKSGAEPYELADQAIEGTAMFEPGYEPSYEGPGDHSDRMNIIGDDSEIIYGLVVKMDPAAGAALRQGLDEFDGY